MPRSLKPRVRKKGPGQQLVIKTSKKDKLCSLCGGIMTDELDIDSGYHDECYTRDIVKRQGYQTSVNRPVQKSLKEYDRKKKSRGHS